MKHILQISMLTAFSVALGWHGLVFAGGDTSTTTGSKATDPGALTLAKLAEQHTTARLSDPDEKNMTFERMQRMYPFKTAAKHVVQPREFYLRPVTDGPWQVEFCVKTLEPVRGDSRWTKVVFDTNGRALGEVEDQVPGEKFSRATSIDWAIFSDGPGKGKKVDFKPENKASLLVAWRENYTALQGKIIRLFTDGTTTYAWVALLQAADVALPTSEVKYHVVTLNELRPLTEGEHRKHIDKAVYVSGPATLAIPPTPSMAPPPYATATPLPTPAPTPVSEPAPGGSVSGSAAPGSVPSA